MSDLLDSRLLDVREIAVRCKISERTVRRWLARQWLPRINLSSHRMPRWRVRLSDLEAFLRERSKA